MMPWVGAILRRRRAVRTTGGSCQDPIRDPIRTGIFRFRWLPKSTSSALHHASGASGIEVRLRRRQQRSHRRPEEDIYQAATDKIGELWNPRLKAALLFRSGEFQQEADLFDKHGGGPVPQWPITSRSQGA